MSVAGGWGTDAEFEEMMERRRTKVRRLVLRSMLYVPANVPKFIDKAHERGADAIILDLEDSVPDSKKIGARKTARESIPLVARGGADVFVRINKPFDQAVGDLDAVVCPGLRGIVFPKVETAVELQVLGALLLEREIAAGMEPGSVGIEIAVESARGMFNLREIIAECQRTERVFAAMYGAEDTTEELGIESTPEGWERFFGNGQMVLMCAAAGIQAFGRLGSSWDYKNLDVYEDSIRRSAAFGFKGAACIHPAQVAVLNRFFGFTPEQLDRAKRTIVTMDEAIKAGRASASVDGKMVDIPTLRRAQRILERQQAIDEKEARKAAVVPH